jgi:hypothetical protein
MLEVIDVDGRGHGGTSSPSHDHTSHGSGGLRPSFLEVAIVRVGSPEGIGDHCIAGLRRRSGSADSGTMEINLKFSFFIINLFSSLQIFSFS